MDKYIYFTATNTTKRIMEVLGANSDNSIDITSAKPTDETLCFTEQDIIYIGFPVFGGRVPQVVLDRLAQMSGNGCKVVIVAVYGNRHYDDAIKEMQTYAEAHGCDVVAAIAAVAQHSIAPTIATGRPDSTDITALHCFKKEIETRLSSGTLATFPRRPTETYKDYPGSPMHPAATDACTGCGICAQQCPMSAIPLDTPQNTDASLCITCMRCVAVCPTNARQLPTEMQAAITARLTTLCTTRRENEIFWE